MSASLLLCRQQLVELGASGICDGSVSPSPRARRWTLQRRAHRTGSCVQYASRRAVTGAARAATARRAFNWSAHGGADTRPPDLAVPGGAEQAESDAATFFESELPGVGAWQFDARRAAQVRQPVLFMMGSATLPFHKEAGERIREWWRKSERYVVPGASHALQIVEPAGVGERTRRVHHASLTAELPPSRCALRRPGTPTLCEYNLRKPFAAHPWYPVRSLRNLRADRRGRNGRGLSRH